MDGSLETARHRGDLHEVADERKIDQVVDELGRYEVDIAALQETKWFGEAEYKVGDSVVITSVTLYAQSCCVAILHARLKNV